MMLKHRTVLSEKERLLRSELTKKVHDENFVRGCLITMKRVCGNPNCKCKARGELHVSKYLSQSRKGQARLTYIPNNLEKTVAFWIKNYQGIKVIIEKISDLHLEKIKIAKKTEGGKK